MLEDLLALDNEGSFSLCNFGLPRLEDVSTCHNFFMCWLVLLRWHFIVLSVLTAYYFYCMKIGFVSRASSFRFHSPPFTCSLHSVKLLNNFKVF